MYVYIYMYVYIIYEVGVGAALGILQYKRDVISTNASTSVPKTNWSHPICIMQCAAGRDLFRTKTGCSGGVGAAVHAPLSLKP